ncbi:hypothetical protein BTN49_0669 [Candidatus Enterovibrio escicola]|uniref:Uncharacterized protein n=1 Tax=Candidatus Enterovibrio escicola TaxID=1927127 RepID=A0A2A5T6I4_9GAMM|nr:hypothetical protein BTN49_0669 [Candidatus Enterovibrio escacola]
MKIQSYYVLGETYLILRFLLPNATVLHITPLTGKELNYH